MKRACQAGAALLAAMLTVTMVATFAAAAAWQQWRAVEIETAERARVQASWLLTGALDWARLILREDRPAVDHLAEPWAIPLQEARLSSFLAADASNTDSNAADQTFLSGQISDLQALLNVASLIKQGTEQPEAKENFRRLFEVLGLPPSQLNSMVENLRFASDISTDNRSAARAALQPNRVEQLVWLGVPPQTVAILLPYVTIVPDVMPKVNLNTAGPEVIYAVGRQISMADAQRLVAERDRQHFATLAEVGSRLGVPPAAFPDAYTSINSSWFEVRGRLRMESVVIEQRSVVQRTGREVKTIVREHGVLQSGLPTAAPAR